MSEPVVAIVTGATNGIGQAAAIELARRGARLGLVARNPAKAEATVARIRAARPGATVDVFVGDLSLMSEVGKLAAELLGRYERIDLLINNAGIQLAEQRVTSEGLPEMIAVNYLAPWYLTSLLRGRLVGSAPARVVVTASEGHRMGWTIDPDTILTDTSPFARGGAMVAYGKSKLLDVLFTLELADRLAGTGVTANCCCPGLVATGLAGTDNAADRVARVLSHTPLVRRPDQAPASLSGWPPIPTSLPGPASSSRPRRSPGSCRPSRPSATPASGDDFGTTRRPSWRSCPGLPLDRTVKFRLD